MKKYLIICAVGALLFSFSTKKNPVTSKYLTEDYVLVPSGDVYTLKVADQLPVNLSEEVYAIPKTDDKNVSMKDIRRIAKNENEKYFNKAVVDEFYCFKTEVTNQDYKEFIAALPENQRAYFYPDTNVWNVSGSNGPINYRHYQNPLYNQHPVVGITLEQANAYANWLTEVYAQKESDVKITFSVPTKKQWIRAARGSKFRTYTGGEFLRNREGAYEMNFLPLDGRFIGRDSAGRNNEFKDISASLRKGLFTTTPVDSYFENVFGIYQMCGNVAELVSDESVAMGGSYADAGYDVRIESEQPAAKASSRIGFRVIAHIEKK